jgi:hypothetical protein
VAVALQDPGWRVGKEAPLDDEKRLVSAEKVPLLMLPKELR